MLIQKFIAVCCFFNHVVFMLYIGRGSREHRGSWSVKGWYGSPQS